MKHRRRESIVQLSADIESVGLLDRDLRATFHGIIEYIDQDAAAKQTADAAADDARRWSDLVDGRSGPGVVEDATPGYHDDSADQAGHRRRTRPRAVCGEGARVAYIDT